MSSSVAIQGISSHKILKGVTLKKYAMGVV